MTKTIKFILTSVVFLMFSGLHAQSIRDSIDVVHYSIHLDEINTGSQTIRGHTEVELTSANGILSEAALELKGLNVDSVLFDGNPIDFTHDGEFITFGFEDEIVPGESLVFDIYYHGSPFSESWGGFHFAGEYAYNLGVGVENWVFYRPDQQSDWQQIDFTQIGPAMIGYLEIENLEKGEYTLAVWEEGYTNINDPASSTDLRVYPNPAKDFVNISTESAGLIEIFSADGQLILQKQVEKSGKETWNTSGQKSGTYLIRHTSRQGKQSSQKIIIRK